MQANIVASFLGGAIGGAATNGLDVLTINKQANPDLNILQLVKKERMTLFTKGLLARVYYHSFQSVIFFNLVLKIGKIYDVDISDD